MVGYEGISLDDWCFGRAEANSFKPKIISKASRRYLWSLLLWRSSTNLRTRRNRYSDLYERMFLQHSISCLRDMEHLLILSGDEEKGCKSRSTVLLASPHRESSHRSCERPWRSNKSLFGQSRSLGPYNISRVRTTSSSSLHRMVYCNTSFGLHFQRTE